MRETRQILEHWSRHRDASFVLATVVDVAGSSYRKPGARMLLQRDGTRVGLISGGCLERDLSRHAFEWTEDGPRTVLYDTRSDALNPDGPYGTGCEGLVQLLLERVEPTRPEPMPTLETLFSGKGTTALATLFACEARPELVGTSLTAETLGRGDMSDRLPANLRERLGSLMNRAADWSRPKSVTLPISGDPVKALVEPIRPPLDLLIFGAGDDVQPVAELADTMGWDVRIASPHAELARPARFPDARRVESGPPLELLERLEVRPETHILLMTHDLKADTALLPAVLATDARFVGLLGPNSRTRRIIERLSRQNQLPDPDQLDRLQTPLGLDLGGDAPSEVALSIVAGVLGARRGAEAGFLQHKEGRIHPDHRRLDLTRESS